MRNSVHFMMLVLGTAATGSGCALDHGDGGEGAITAEVIMTNGSSINGLSVNGQGMPGSEAHGASATGTTALGSALSGLTLQGSELASVRVADGGVVSGGALVGARFSTNMPGGTRFDLRIDSHAAIPSEHHAGSTVSRYALSYRLSGETAWTPMCGELDHAPVLAIAVAGRWSYAEGVPGGGGRIDEPGWITFACSGYALYKCAALGYEPWTSVGGVSLVGHHQACLRAHRADYCGDGRPYTVDGHLINIFDALGVQDDTESWSLEAEWDADGARCLTRPRIEGTEPDCLRERCEAQPGWGSTLVVTEAP